MDVEDEAAREFTPDEILPWGHIDCGVTDKFFKSELEKALRGETSRDCLDKCTACGLECKKRNADELSPPPPANGAAPPMAKQPMVKQPMAAPARIRISYTKLMPLAMLSHTEMMTLFFRAISRAGLPVAFSEGFNPHPKLSFGPALGVGIESEAEILDIELTYAIDLMMAVRALNMALPSGVRVSEARYISPKEAPAGVGLTSYEYEMEVPGEADAEGAISGFLAKAKRGDYPRLREGGRQGEGNRYTPDGALPGCGSGRADGYFYADGSRWQGRETLRGGPGYI